MTFEREEDLLMTYLDEDYMSTTSQSSSSWTFQEPDLYTSESHYFPLINFFQGCYQHEVSQQIVKQFIPQPVLPPASGKSKRGRKKRDQQQHSAACTVKQSLVPILPAKQEIQKEEEQQQQQQQVEKEVTKRQERLIKNRAAALLSRKRKREHLNSLEEEKNKLMSENSELRESMNQLARENTELKQKLNNNHGIILMVNSEIIIVDDD
ncbi:hypothetical protein G6F25_002041 [Rhizopus arrhizus]|nr:hypothetical protein G6F25_002041 [Rhizopus arrhizus]